MRREEKIVIDVSHRFIDQITSVYHFLIKPIPFSVDFLFLEDKIILQPKSYWKY